MSDLKEIEEIKNIINSSQYKRGLVLNDAESLNKWIKLKEHFKDEPNFWFILMKKMYHFCTARQTEFDVYSDEYHEIAFEYSSYRVSYSKYQLLEEDRKKLDEIGYLPAEYSEEQFSKMKAAYQNRMMKVKKFFDENSDTWKECLASPWPDSGVQVTSLFLDEESLDFPLMLDLIEREVLWDNAPLECKESILLNFNRRDKFLEEAAAILQDINSQTILIEKVRAYQLKMADIVSLTPKNNHPLIGEIQSTLNKIVISWVDVEDVIW